MKRWKMLPVMKLFLMGLLGAMGCALESGESTLGDPRQVEAEVQSVLDGVNAAASAKDVDAFMALWARTDSVVYVRSGTAFLGWDAVAENHAGAFDSPGVWSFESAETHVRATGPDAGVGTAFIRTGSVADDGSTNGGWFTITMAVERRPEGWRIIQAHGSYPEPGTAPRPELETGGE